MRAFFLSQYLLLFLFGCGGEVNPVLGKWDILEYDTGQSGMNSYYMYVSRLQGQRPFIEFRETELTFQLLDEEKITLAVSYSRSENGDWYVCPELFEGCSPFTFTDGQYNNAETNLFSTRIIVKRLTYSHG